MNKFFVYGTLRPGEIRWSALESYAIDVKPAKLYGAMMYTTGSYPFILLCTNADVVGEIITVDEKDILAVRQRLDQIEGYNERYGNDSLFVRIERTVVNTETNEDVLAYMYVGGLDSEIGKDRYRRIESGDWKKRNA